MPVSLDINRAYVSKNFVKVSSQKFTEELLDRKISTGKMNLIQNGITSKGMDKRLTAKDVDLSALSKIDFSKVSAKTQDLSSNKKPQLACAL